MSLKSGFIKLIWTAFILCLLLGEVDGMSSVLAGEKLSEIDNTMLMFVGEDIEVVTAASRYPESPSAAPALVQVVDHGEIEAYGYTTLADVLASKPGFYMADQGMGLVPWLRGIPNGILVLYDGVPVPSGGNRNYSPLGLELSLDNVKRIEIIRGPGSVLWGTDAFAGIVNIVPFTGKDIQGGTLSVRAGSDHRTMGFANAGHRGKNWDAYLSAYGAMNRYHSEDYLNVFKAGEGEYLLEEAGIDDSEYLEAAGNFSFNDVLFISGRYSDFSRNYTFEDLNGLSWFGKQKNPVNYAKINFSKAQGRSHWNATAYYQYVAYKQEVSITKVTESSNIYFGELIWDRRFLKKGLMTAGISYRETHVDGPAGSTAFIPAYLSEDYQIVPAPFKDEKYRNCLWSLFSQYRHQFAPAEVWLGLRLDDNSWYDDLALNYSLGFNMPLKNNWRIKANFGSAYRTPYSIQVIGNKNVTGFEEENDVQSEDILTRDEVTTLNLQLEWMPDQATLFSATSFYSRLSDHVEPDPYAVTSQPSAQEFTGIELYIRKKFNNRLEGYACASKLFSFGDDFDFRFVSSSFFRPDGTQVKEYDTWSQEYNSGADFMFSSGILWHAASWLDWSLTAVKTSSIPYAYEENTISGSYKNPFLLNTEIRIKGFPWQDSQVSIGCTNLLDREFTYPGFYGPVEGPPFIFTLGFSLKF